MKNYNAFYDSVKNYPEEIAVLESNQAVTYFELYILTESIYIKILSEDVKQGEIVGIFMNPGIIYIATILAINKLGAIFMPMEPIIPVKRLGTILSKVSVRMLITTPELLPTLQKSLSYLQLMETIDIVTFDRGYQTADVQNASNKRVEFSKATTDNELTSCYLFFTSGSTGEPKAVEGSVEGLDHFIRWEITEFSISSKIKIPLFAPLAFDVSLRDIFVPLYAGGTVCVPEPELKHNIFKLISWIVTTGITLMHIVPSLFRLMKAEFALNPQLKQLNWSVRFILLAGEPLFYSDISSWNEIAFADTSFVNLYGPSETTLAKLFFRIQHISGKDHEMVPLGRPIPGSEVLITNNGNLCDPGEIGEINIETPYRSKGYYGDKVLTAEKFIGDQYTENSDKIIYKTGDFGKLMPDGYIHFVGRNDSMVKIQGNRVELQEVEGVMNNSPYVEQAIVSVLTNSNSEPEIAAYYVSAEEPNLSAIKDYLSEILPSYMIPIHFMRLDTFPLNINGKVDRKALPKVFVQEKNDIPCETEIELVIESIWRDILKIGKIGKKTSFFAMGGSSLKAIQIISRIRKEFNVVVKLAYFFTKPTINDLAMYIENSRIEQQ